MGKRTLKTPKSTKAKIDTLIKRIQGQMMPLSKKPIIYPLTTKKRQNMTRELKNLAKYFQNIFSHLPIGIMFINREGVITSINESAMHYLPTTSDIPLFRKFWDIFPDDFFGFSLETAIQEKNIPQIINIKKLVIKSIFIDENNIQGFLFTIDQNENNSQISFNVLNPFLSTLSHDLKNPLGGIKGFTELLERDLQKSHIEHKFIQKIKDGVQSCEKILDEMTKICREFELKYKKTNIVSIIQTLIKEKGVDIKILSKSKINMYVDPELIKEALDHIMTNAIEASTEQSSIELDFYKKNDMVNIELKDNGHGISADLLKDVFLPLVSTKGKQRGYGLTLANQIIEAHKGYLSLLSDSNKGTTAIITLPIKGDPDVN